MRSRSMDDAHRLIGARRVRSLSPPKIIGGVCILVALWWIAALIIGSSLILPTPAEVVVRWCELALTVDFWITTATSLLRILIGFACGMIVGGGLAILMGRFQALRILFSPALAIVRATPVVSFIIIALIFIQTPFLPSFISFLMVVPVAWENTDKGLDAVDESLLEMAHLFALGRWQKVRLIYGPTLKPYLLSAAIACMGLAWKSGVTAEVIASPVWAIGRQLDDAKIYLQTTDLFAWTLTLVLVSLALEAILKLIVKAVSKPSSPKKTDEESLL